MLTTGTEIQVRRSSGGLAYRTIVVDGGERTVVLKAVTVKYSPPQLVPIDALCRVEGRTDMYEVDDKIAALLGVL